MGIDHLLEMIVLTAEMGDLKANPNRAARGTVIEARLDKGRGRLCPYWYKTVRCARADIIIAGTAVGHVRVMTDDRGERTQEAGPSVPVEISGMSEVRMPVIRSTLLPTNAWPESSLNSAKPKRKTPVP